MSTKKERKFWPAAYKLWWERVQQGSYMHFAEYTSSNEGKVILDIGTGTGAYLNKINKSNFYIFTDFDLKMLQKAQVKAHKKLPINNYTFAIMDVAKALNTSLANIDVISALHVITCVQDQVSFIKSALKLLNNSGVLLLYISKLPVAHDVVCKMSKLNAFNIKKVAPSLVYEKVKINAINHCYIIQKSDNELFCQ